MAEEFEVRGAHEDKFDEAAEHDRAGMAGKLAVITAVLATVGALFSYMAGATQADAGLLKNDAAIRKTEAANQWSFFQAKSTKQSISELGRQLATDGRQREQFAAEARRYDTEKAEVKLEAEKLEKESVGFDAQSEARMHEHHRWAQATTVLQMAIAMAAIALLTRRRWLEKVVFALSGVGVVIGVLAYLHL
jgi:lipopolysaccharide export LptBFGC system permease protein LptF